MKQWAIARSSQKSSLTAFYKLSYSWAILQQVQTASVYSRASLCFKEKYIVSANQIDEFNYSGQSLSSETSGLGIFEHF